MKNKIIELLKKDLKNCYEFWEVEGEESKDLETLKKVKNSKALITLLKNGLLEVEPLQLKEVRVNGLETIKGIDHKYYKLLKLRGIKDNEHYKIGNIIIELSKNEDEEDIKNFGTHDITILNYLIK